MIGIGQTLGNYHVVSKLGSGGMGAVYMAEHPLIGKKVALKVIHRELSMNKEVVTRFFNEARAVNQIGNEHIVDISDFGRTAEGEYFFIMELLNGLSLGEVLQKERVMPAPRALHVAAQIADALAAAHTVGIIHRDLKPDNVFLIHKLGEPDFVKILDFGLAKLVAEGGPANLTQKGVILGTPQYMSPEQCESRKDVDGRTDVYSLGILLYQMVTGVLPFDGQSMGEVLVKQVASAVPPPRGVNPNVPPSVEQIILRCLGKKADTRFQNMTELHQALLDPDRYLMGGAVGSQARTQFMSRGSGSHVAPPEIGVQAVQASAPTMMHAGPSGPVQAHGGQGAQGHGGMPQGSVADARTLFLDGGSNAAPNKAQVAHAATEQTPAIQHHQQQQHQQHQQQHQHQHQQQLAQQHQQRTSMPLPALQIPAPVANATMLLDPDVAAGPMAPRRRPGGGKWAIGIIFLLVAAGGTVAALMLANPTSEPAASVASTTAGADANLAPAEEKPLVAKGPGPTGSDPVIQTLPPPMVKIAVTSVPPGAMVLDETTGEEHGPTPFTLEIERDTEHVLVFKHADCGEKTKPIKASNDTEILVELQRLPRSTSPKSPRPPRVKKGKPAAKDVQNAIDDDTILEPTMD